MDIIDILLITFIILVWYLINRSLSLPEIKESDLEKYYFIDKHGKKKLKYDIRSNGNIFRPRTIIRVDPEYTEQCIKNTLEKHSDAIKEIARMDREKALRNKSKN